MQGFLNFIRLALLSWAGLGRVVGHGDGGQANYSDQPARWSPQIGGSVERIYLKCPQFRLKNDSVAGRNSKQPPGI